MKKLVRDLSNKEVKRLIRESIQDSAIQSILEDDDPVEEPQPQPEEAGNELELEIPKWERVIITLSMQKVFTRYGVHIPNQDKPYIKRIDMLFPMGVLADLDVRQSPLKSELQTLNVATSPVITQIKKRLSQDRKKAVKGGQMYSVLECVRGTHGNLVFRRVV